MKTLLLLRHAKSDWGDETLRDFDRPLSQRGERDAPRIGRALAERGVLPDLVVSSPANRARTTAAAVVEAAGLELEPRFEGGIYEASPGELMQIIRKLPDQSGCAMLVGHNPGFENTLARLTGQHERMPTAALACITFQVDRWEDVEDDQGKLLWLITPKTLVGDQ